MKINKLNYEAFALEYLEGTLSSEQMEAMEQFLSKHPAIRAELEGMKDFLVLKPEPIVFDNKKQLLKTPSRDRIVWMSPWRWSAAASILLLIAFMFYPKEKAIDPIVTVPTKENPMETDPIKSIPNSQENTIEKESSAIDLIAVEEVIQPTEELATKEPFQPKNKKQTATNNKRAERVANYKTPIQSVINDQPTKVVAHQIAINDQLANTQPVDVKNRQREIIPIDLLEPTDIALLNVPMDIDRSAINFIAATSSLIAKVETPEKRTLKNLMGKLPGNGVKISIIPSFFTD